MTLDEMKEKFASLYGDANGVSTYFAPGRVNLIGEHTDYNGGHVFPCALTIGTYAVARKRNDDIVKLYSANIKDGKGDVVSFSVNDIKYREEYGWANYPAGVLWALQEKGISFDSGFETVIWGDIPNGSGLSSSASLEVLTGVVVRDIFGFSDISNQDLAVTGQYSENRFNGMNCGIMDQFAVAMGKRDNAIFLDTASMEFEYAPISLSDSKIVIVNSKVKHSLVDSAYNRRREECSEALSDLKKVCDIETLGDLDEETFEKHASAIKDEVCRKRAKHAVYENRRTINAVDALKKGDIEGFGRLMDMSHVSLRDDYEVSCEEIDILVDLAHSVSGVIGSRITGGGFGGCTVSIVKNDAIDDFKKIVAQGYEEKTGKAPEIYIVDIGDGARVLR